MARADLRAQAEADLRKQLADLGGKGFGLPIEEQEYEPMERIKTGSILLDEALGGGIPKGRITEIYGPNSGGKTSLCYSIIGQAQKFGERAAYVDMEQAFDDTWAAKFGVDVQKLWWTQPDNGEQALGVVEKYCASGLFSLVVIDSVAALAPKAEIDGEMGDAHMGLQARMMSQFCRKNAANIARSSSAIVFVNQLRMKIGMMFGNPEVTTGGEALKFYASIRLDVRSTERLKDGDEVIGQTVRVKAMKNKTAPPLREANLRLIYSKGFDFEDEVIEVALKRGTLTREGAWFKFGEHRAQGRANMVQYLRDHPDLLAQLEA